MEWHIQRPGESQIKGINNSFQTSQYNLSVIQYNLSVIQYNLSVIQYNLSVIQYNHYRTIVDIKVAGVRMLPKAQWVAGLSITSFAMTT